MREVEEQRNVEVGSDRKLAVADAERGSIAQEVGSLANEQIVIAAEDD